MKIHVFEEDKLSRCVLDRTWPNLAAESAENDPNMAPQNDQKSCPKNDQHLDRNKSEFCATLAPARRNALASYKKKLLVNVPFQGGIIGGAKESLFEICRCLRHIKALRFTDFAVGLARSAPPLRCGRRIDFPKGDRRRPPAFWSSVLWGQAFRLYQFRRFWRS